MCARSHTHTHTHTHARTHARMYACTYACLHIRMHVSAQDPLADGPVIQNAATRALDKGTTLDQVIDLVRRVSPSTSAALVLFTYFNPIMRRGMDKFCQELSEAGASGLLVPDIPLEETDEIRAACNKFGLDLILLVTPTTPQVSKHAFSPGRVTCSQQGGWVFLPSQYLPPVWTQGSTC